MKEIKIKVDPYTPTPEEELMDMVKRSVGRHTFSITELHAFITTVRKHTLTDLLEEIEKEIKHADECIENAGNDEDKVADEGFKTAMKAVKALIQKHIDP